MDIETSADILLRESGYKTYRWPGKKWSVLAFEDDCIFGFLHVFESASALLDEWRTREKELLTAHALTFRTAGEKSWNVYNVLLTAEPTSPTLERQVLRIDEDLRYARKLARSGVTDETKLKSALMPLLPILSSPAIENRDFEARLRSTLAIIAPEIIDAFFGDAPGEDLPRLLQSFS